jgi:hypothetical protein
MFYIYSKDFHSRVHNLMERLFRTEHESETVFVDLQTKLDDAMQKPEDKQALR